MTILPPVVQTLKNMKGIIYSAILILLHTAASAQEGKENIVMFWNIENFFDFKDEGKNDSDREFSPEGERRWTGSRFYAKCNAIAKTVLWIKDIYGNIPDVAGFAEVENLFVLKSIINSGPLKKSDYRIVHYDSSDPRGIDVALIYRNDIFEKTASKPCRITDSSGNPANTRDILCVTLKNRKTGHLTAFIVNHHPSKFSGASSSRPKRETAMRRLKSICDSIRSEHRGIDFNIGGQYDKYVFGTVLQRRGNHKIQRQMGSHRYVHSVQSACRTLQDVNIVPSFSYDRRQDIRRIETSQDIFRTKVRRRSQRPLPHNTENRPD